MTTLPVALVTGISGQTSAYLTKILLNSEFKVVGTTRHINSSTSKNIQLIENSTSSLSLFELDTTSLDQVINCLEYIKPTHIFHLSGMSSVSRSFEAPLEAHHSISTSCANFIEAIKTSNVNIRFFNAVSSDCYGDCQQPANEESPFSPRSPYGFAKAYAADLVRVARSHYNLFCCNGILSNHESPLRPASFVLPKIIKGLDDIRAGKSNCLSLGNLNTIRDWGWAPDYAEAIYRILLSSYPTDYIVATGTSHSLRELVDYACSYYGLNPDTCITTSKKSYRLSDISTSLLSPDKIIRELGWHPTTTFPLLIEKLANKALF